MPLIFKKAPFHRTFSRFLPHFRWKKFIFGVAWQRSAARFAANDNVNDNDNFHPAGQFSIVTFQLSILICHAAMRSLTP